MSVLDASITKNISIQKLIRSATRGGLSAVNNQRINIFLLAEKHFRNVTKKINMQKMPTDEIMNCLLKNALEKMLRLYIRVRSFSYAKDVYFKKILQSRTTDKKNLRANLKNRSDQEINDS